MDETKVEVSQTTEQEAAPAGVEAQAEQTAETVETEKVATAAETEPEQEPKNDTETEHEAAAEEPKKDEPASRPEAGEPSNGADHELAAVPDVADVSVVTKQLTEAKSKLLDATARAKAIELNVPPERVKYALQMASIGEIDPMADDAEKQIGEKLQQVLADVPELARVPGGTGAAGDHRRTSTAPLDPFERGFSGK